MDVAGLSNLRGTSYVRAAEVVLLKLPKSRLRAAALLLASLFFIVAGAMHFANAEFFLAMMPPYLPFHHELVAISGVFELLGGLGLLVPQTRRFASLGLFLLLIAVYPANVHMMLHPDQFADLGPPIGLYIRMPIQFLFLAWVFWIGKSDSAIDDATTTTAG